MVGGHCVGASCLTPLDLLSKILLLVLCLGGSGPPAADLH